jgi:tetratricopeptide (TPR) repeat protein
LKTAISTAILLLACCAVPPARAQGPMVPNSAAHPAFRATHYDVTATLSPAEQMLTAHVTVDFVATDASSTVLVELHPNLQVTAVTNAAGKSQTFQRVDRNSLQLRVDLDTAIGAGQKITLNFDYAGPLSNEENSPAPGLRLASIGNEAAYLLLPARWFPLTNYPVNRYTGVYKIQVPEAFTVAGTGKTGPPQMISGKVVMPDVIHPGQLPPAPSQQKIFTFRDDRPEASGTFIAAPYKQTIVDADGIKIPVYTFPASTESAQLFGRDMSKIITDFSDDFGPLADPNITIAELPDGGLTEFAAPGLALVSQRNWSGRGNTATLSRIAAAQWFGIAVMPASTSDVWVTDGLARYGEAMYAEQESGKDAVNLIVEEYAVRALMYETASPITQSAQLKPYTTQYASVVQDKGAIVFHMLHSLMGDDLFRAAVKDFYARYKGLNARNTDFEDIAQEYVDAKAQGISLTPVKSISTNAPPPAPPTDTHSLQPFFAQWLSSTGIPEFTLDYKVFRNAKGFQVVGKVKQTLDTFSMPMEIEVQTEGNPETKTIQVTGAETPFSIDTFGRPKPGGIVLDPHDYILKASEKLRIRSIISRGETLQDQNRFMDAIEQYQRALDVQKNNSLALFRMGEAFFYQKNYTAAANSFRSAIGGDMDLSTKWVETWSHLYMGKIYDVTGQRERAVNEYRLAKQTRDNTGGAQEEADKYSKAPYKEGQ